MFSARPLRTRLLRSIVLGSGFIACSACAGVQAEPALAATPQAPAKAAVDPKQALASGRELLFKSVYKEAESELRRADVGATRVEAGVALSELLLTTGRYAEAVSQAEQTRKLLRANQGKIRGELLYTQAEALRRQGQLDEAFELLKGVEKDAEARRARLLKGEILLELGNRTQGELIWMTLIDDYNSDAINDKDGEGLALVGRAAHLLRSPRDANDAFNEAERAKPKDRRTLLWRAELFLEKYDPGHAEEVTREVLEQSPNHPEALVWMAHVKLDQALDFDEATRLAEQALSVNPRLAHAHLVLAGVDLRDMELAAADKHLDEGLRHNPRELDLLSMKAAVRFLADDKTGFEAAKAKVLKLNPSYSRMYRIIGEYAEWEHRYDEIVKMMQEALKLDDQDAKAQAQLGLNLIRGGYDDLGVKQLQSAFDKDAFNVRVFNTLNLYEKTIPREYETLKEGEFTYRFHKEDKALLSRYVPGLMRDAWRSMTDLYGFTPKQPVGVELYLKREDFSIRTSGLPNTGIQGVCFGQTLASISPRAETFNLGMTLWHELAHVFHIQMSSSHVPRWFTEGMAEYETLIERDEWRREHDPDLYVALRDNRLPKLGSMNQAFTRAEEMSDIATAYYASSQVLVMLGEKYGRAKLNQMLRLWGSGKHTPEVFREALGKSSEELDREFSAYAKQQLARYERQFVPISRTAALDIVEKEAKENPASAKHQTLLGLALLRHGQVEGAEQSLKRALSLDAKYPDAVYLMARIHAAKKEPAKAIQLFKQLIADKNDGYAVRMALANLAQAAQDEAGFERELNEAHRLDPSMSEPLQGLVDLATKRKDQAAELAGLRKLAKLDEHEPRVYQRLMRILLEEKKLDEAREVGEAALWADLSGLQTHRVFGEVLMASDMIPRAIYEFESALLCDGRPKDLAQVHELLAQAYAAVPNPKKAAEHRALAKKALGS